MRARENGSPRSFASDSAIELPSGEAVRKHSSGKSAGDVAKASIRSRPEASGVAEGREADTRPAGSIAIRIDRTQAYPLTSRLSHRTTNLVTSGRRISARLPSERRSLEQALRLAIRGQKPKRVGRFPPCCSFSGPTLRDVPTSCSGGHGVSGRRSLTTGASSASRAGLSAEQLRHG